MMKRTRLKVFALAAALAAVGAVSLAAAAAADSPEATLKQIAGYRGWTRVTEAPIPAEVFYSGG